MKQSETSPEARSREPAQADQRTKNEVRNADFFDDWADYHQLVEGLDSYERTARALRGELAGRVVDVGSGGVVNYSTDPITELVLVDLGEAHSQTDRVPAKARALVGSACALPLADGGFDRVLMQMLVHHLAEKDFATTRDRVRTAFAEAHRVLVPGGRLVVVESAMNPFLEWAQRIAFPLTRRLLAALGHPLVLQWSPRSLAAFARQAGFGEVEIRYIPRGKMMIFLGRKMPTWLVPVRFVKVIATKSGQGRSAVDSAMM
jgi:SAM-dependent methyltransferase